MNQLNIARFCTRRFGTIHTVLFSQQILGFPGNIIPAGLVTKIPFTLSTPFIYATHSSYLILTLTVWKEMIYRACGRVKRCSLYRMTTILCGHCSATVSADNRRRVACRFFLSRHTRFIRHSIRRDQMSLPLSNVYTTRYVVDASEAVGKT